MARRPIQPFATASQAVTALIDAGAFGYVNAGLSAGWSEQQIAYRLQEVFGQIPGLPATGRPFIYWQSIYAVISRFEEGQRAGAWLNARPVNPLDPNQHVGRTDCAAGFQYDVEQGFNSLSEDEYNSKLFSVSSAVPLSKNQVLAAIEEQVALFELGVSGSPPFQTGEQWQRTGPGRVTGAWKCIG